MELEWRICENGWCDLRIVKLGWSSGKGGVYVIWSGKGVVYVGQGDFEERFSKHRRDPQILKYVANRGLYVTWAVVEKGYRSGVERFLADILEPLVDTTVLTMTPSTSICRPGRYSCIRKSLFDGLKPHFLTGCPHVSRVGLSSTTCIGSRQVEGSGCAPDWLLGKALATGCQGGASR